MPSRRDYLHACSAGALGALAGCTSLPLVSGSGDSEPALITSSGVHRLAGFGLSIATDDDILVVGAQAALNSGNRFGGTAFVYERSDGTWVKQARLRPPGEDVANPLAERERLSFGFYVAAESGTVVVGTADSPAAYTYEQNGQDWQRTGRLYPDIDNPESCISTSMAFDGDTVVLATQCDGEDEETRVQTVHVFERRDDEWQEVAALQRDDPRKRDRYGYSVDVGGDTLAVASTVGGDDDDEESHQSVVHVYERTSSEWAKQAEIRPESAYSYGGVKNTIAVSGDTLAVGGLLTDEDPHPGRAYVYERDDGGWQQQTVLRPDVLNQSERFGKPLALRGDTLVAAVDHVTVDDNVEGSAFRYARSGGEWELQRRYSESDAVRAGRFGYSVALSEERVAIGGKVEREDIADREAVYVFPR